ncbi:MAG TPA: PAS domain S-box protein [Dehalococcoidia bacterium]|nr:PAS domain S-box protein [Dehalococcoidia bacterium]
MIDEASRSANPEAEAVDVPSMFPLLFDQLADSVYVTDSDGIIQYVNKAFEVTTGYTHDEAVGQTPRILKSGVHPREVYEELWATIQSGSPFRFIFGNRKKSGEIYEEGVMISPIRGLDGKTSHYLSMGRVINAFRQNYDVFTLLADSSPGSIYLQRDGKIFFVNEHLTNSLGYEPEEIIGREWLDLVVPEDRETAAQGIAAMLAGDLKAPFEYRVTAGDGGVRWLMATVRRVVFRGIQSVAGDFVAGHLTDITDRKDAEDRLQRALAMYAATIESTTDGIFVVDQDGRMVSRNRRFDELWNIRSNGTSEPEQRQIFAAILDQLTNPGAFQRMVDATLADRTINSASRFDLLDGRHIEVFSRPQSIDGAQVGRVWSWRDVTERSRFEAALLRLANHDAVTGLLTRRKFQEEVERALAAHQDSIASLLMLDLDGFKDVNDTFGHQAGDQVLAQVARALTESGCGDMIGRFGGDEFAIFLPGCGHEAALAAAKRVLRMISTRDYVASGAEITVSCSIGVAVFPDSTGGGDILSAADLAMYEAKASGGGCIEFYTPRLRERSRQNLRSDWHVRVREAIAKRQGRLFIQEAVGLQTRTASIYKLSLRTQGARSRIISPDGLGPFAEQAGLPLQFDRWLLDEAIGLDRRLSEAGRSLRLSLDLCAGSLRDRQIVAGLLELARNRSSRAAPVLEVLDIGSVTGLRPVIRNLRKAGYAFKVADSSAQRLLETLQVVPVGYIKIGGAITSRVAGDLEARAVAAGVVALARSIGAGTLAAGIRDAATLAALRSLGVDNVRGPYTGRARPASALLVAAERRNAA